MMKPADTPKDLSRRDFVRKTLLTTGTCALAGNFSPSFYAQAKPGKDQSDELIKYSACLVNCGSRCPVKLHIHEGVITKVSPEDGIDQSSFGLHQIRPCLRGRAIRHRVYSPDRIKYPMVRVGKRGAGKFKRISWDDAVTMIADKLKETIAKYGNEAIYYQYGSGSTGANLQGRNACKRLLSLAGGFLEQYGTYSTAQISAITPYVYGTGRDTGGSLFADIAYSDYVLMFGQNLVETRMSGGGQTAELYHALQKSKAKVVIIDPIRTDSVTALHADWIPIRPGTDAALISAMIYVLITENRIDDKLLRRYAVGWDEASLPATAPANSSYRAYILGHGPDRTAKTPYWASMRTGIPEEKIVKLARDLANAKAAWISQGWGIQRAQTGEHAARAILTLPIITGHFGRPGTNNGAWGGSVTYPVPGFTIPNPVKTALPFFLWTDAITHGPELTAIKDGIRGKEKLDTGIKFLWNYASNVPGNQHSDLNRTHEILVDPALCPFILVWDTHMTATARYADLLLPDTLTPETSDLINNSYATGAYHYVIRLEAAIEPLWDNRETYSVLCDIAEKLGIRDAFTEGKTYQEWIETSYHALREQEPHIPPFENSSGLGVIDRKLARTEDFTALKNFRDHPEKYPLDTPSGKVEIYSEALARLSEEWILPAGDELPAIPKYVPAVEGIEDQAAQEHYPLQMIGFHTKGHTHSSYCDVALLNEAAPDHVWMNPIDAASRNLKSDMLVDVFNQRGCLRMPLKITERIIPGVIGIPQGSWAKVNGKGVDIGGCINRLTSLRPSALAKGNPQHTNLVEVRQA